MISKICSFSSTFVLHLSSKLYNSTLHSKEVNEVFFFLLVPRHGSGATEPQKSQVARRGHRFALPLFYCIPLFSAPPRHHPITLPLHHPVAPMSVTRRPFDLFPLRRVLQSIFSTFPMIFSSKMGKTASSSRTSSNTTPQSNSSLTFLK